MKRNLFKKLSLFMALALVVTALAPMATTKAAAKPNLNATKKTIYVGKSYNFNVKNKVKKSTYKWSTSNKAVATVNAKNGVAKAVAPGTATISCKITLPTKKTTTLKATVTVKQDATAVKISNPVDAVKIGDATYQFKRNITPSTSTNKTFYVIDSASNTAGAVAVNDKGVVNVTQSGEFKIKAVTARGKVQFAAGNWRAESEWLTVKVAAPDVTTVEAFSSKTVKVTFEDAISSEVKASNFSINGQIIANAELAADAKSVLLTLTTSLAEGTEYTLTTTDILAAKGSATSSGTKTFTYTKAEAASMTFKSTKVSLGKDVEVVVKDANGNDITPDFSILDYDVTSSDFTVVTRNLTTSHVGKSTVNVVLRGTEISTGDKEITVVENLTSSLEISYLSLKNDKNDDGFKFAADPQKHWEVYTMVKDHNGIVIDDSTLFYTSKDIKNYDVLYTFESSNPAVATVDSYNRTVTGISAGTATITVKAAYSGAETTKQFTVTVTAQKELPYPKTIQIVSEAGTGTSTKGTAVVTVVNTAEVDLVDGFKVVVKDQYGDDYSVPVNIKLTAGNTDPLNIAVVDGQLKDILSLSSNTFYEVEPATAAASCKGSVTITASVTGDNSIKTTGTIRVVDQGKPAGHNVYVFGLYDTKDTNGSGYIDRNDNKAYGSDHIFEAPQTKSANYKGTGVLVVGAYKKDSNGNQYMQMKFAGASEAAIEEYNEFAISIPKVKVSGVDTNFLNVVTTGSAITKGKFPDGDLSTGGWAPDWIVPVNGVGNNYALIYTNGIVGKNYINIIVGEEVIATNGSSSLRKTLAKTSLITVVNSEPTPTNVKQVVNSISVSVGESIGDKLKSAFVVSDQYDRVMGSSVLGAYYYSNLYSAFYDFDFDAKLYSDNSSIVRVDQADYNYAYANAKGTVNMSVVIAGQTYRVTVVVN